MVAQPRSKKHLTQVVQKHLTQTKQTRPRQTRTQPSATLSNVVLSQLSPTTRSIHVGEPLFVTRWRLTIRGLQISYGAPTQAKRSSTRLASRWNPIRANTIRVKIRSNR